MYAKTPIAARQLGTTFSHLHSLIRCGKIAPPDKDSSGDYAWTARDIQRARQALQKAKQHREIIVRA